jgi:hypothetical protein
VVSSPPLISLFYITNNFPYAGTGEGSYQVIDFTTTIVNKLAIGDSSYGEFHGMPAGNYLVTAVINIESTNANTLSIASMSIDKNGTQVTVTPMSIVVGTSSVSYPTYVSMNGLADYLTVEVLMYFTGGNNVELNGSLMIMQVS